MMPAKKDISGRFVTTTWQSGRYFYKEVSGELGVPGQVVKHYSAKENRGVSAGTGGHASHLVGKQFGAPGDRGNLTLGNPNINTYAPKNLQEALGKGGNYHKLEEEWTAKLNNGTRIW